MSEARGSATLMRTLVAFQVALSLVLLVGAETFVWTLVKLYDVDRGFRNEQVLTMSIELPENYMQEGKSTETWSRVLEALRAIPGLRVAGLSTFTPFSGRDPGETPVRIRSNQTADSDNHSIRVNQVSEGYFETLGIQLFRGRMLTDHDSAGSAKVALINQSAAHKYFENRDPIGQFLDFDSRGAATSYQIVGVVGDTKHRNLREPSPAFVFIPTRQPLIAERRVTLAVESAVANGVATLSGPIRRTLDRVDSRLLVSEVITIREQLDSTLLTERLLSRLSTAFGVLALILVAIGLYGVLSYRIGQQRRSIGIQMALGALPSSVAFSVVRQSALLIAAGLVAGLPFAFLAARVADSMLWGLNSSDPIIYFVAVFVVCLVGLVSAYLPARRATAIAPAEALRPE